MTFFKRLKTALSDKSLALATLTTTTAWSLPAAAEDWNKPATDFFSKIESGLVDVAGPVVGVGIVAYGMYAVATGKIDWTKVGYFVFAGLLIFVGPTVLRSLLGSG